VINDKKNKNKKQKVGPGEIKIKDYDLKSGGRLEGYPTW
jgi:hypothetical protein